MKTRNLKSKQHVIQMNPLKPGMYIVAVSGGVDSMVLLHLLSHQSNIQLIIGHFDHGIRPDSQNDRLFVQNTATRLGLPFVYEKAQLGPGASEDIARAARYKFLESARQSHKAIAIITAHQQDDVLETALINLLRGTNRKGLTSLSNQPTILRPLLHVPKETIRSYAQSERLIWQEDSTNQEDTYLRNYIRHHLLPHFDANTRTRLLGIINATRDINNELDMQLINLLHMQPSQRVLDRAWFISLPHVVGREFLATWLRTRGISNFDAKTLERLAIGAKVNRAGSLINISGTKFLAVEKNNLALVG